MLLQSGSPKRLRVGLILVLRQVVSEFCLAEESQRSQWLHLPCLLKTLLFIVTVDM